MNTNNPTHDNHREFNARTTKVLRFLEEDGWKFDATVNYYRKGEYSISILQTTPELGIPAWVEYCIKGPGMSTWGRVIDRLDIAVDETLTAIRQAVPQENRQPIETTISARLYRALAQLRSVIAWTEDCSMPSSSSARLDWYARRMLVIRNAARTGLDVPEVAANPAMNGSSPDKQWVDLCNQKGWDNETQIIHLEGFLATNGLMADFLAYAKKSAVEEV